MPDFASVPYLVHKINFASWRLGLAISYMVSKLRILFMFSMKAKAVLFIAITVVIVTIFSLIMALSIWCISKIQTMIVSSGYAPQWATFENICEMANALIPLEEFFSIMGMLCTMMLVGTIYRFVKSWIFGVS